MPNALTLAPRGALLTQQDWEAYASTVLFDGPGSVTLSASTGRIDDMLAAVNGRGSDPIRSLGADIDAGWTGAGTITAGIDANDRVFVECSAEGFDLTASIDNSAYGFDVLGQSAVNTAGTVHRLTATADWLRGNVENKRLRLDPATGAAFDAPAYAFRAQSIPVLLRHRGIGDADDTAATVCLEALDNAANDNVFKRLRWLIDADGHIIRTRPTGVAAVLTSWRTTANAIAMREILGFSGDETETTIGGLEVLRATYPAAGVLTPSRPFDRMPQPSHEWQGSAVALVNNRIANNTISTRIRYRVDMYIDGRADRIDRGRYFVHRWAPLATPGTPCSIYQDWGDGRRALRTIAATGAALPYSLLYTAEADGERGRLLVRVPEDAPPSASVDWPGRLERRAAASLEFVGREGGQ